jgi:uncharacterized protein YjbI with pentapeptide repeats
VIDTKAIRATREYWSSYRGEIVTQFGLQLLVGVLVGLGVGAWLFSWQASVEEDREEKAQALDAAQAERAEMLADVAYVRETLRDGGPMAFLNLNLRNANLSGLDMGCDMVGVDDENGEFVTEGEFVRRNYADQGDGLVRERPGYGPTDHDNRYLCADFSGSDLTGANLDRANLTGARFLDARFAPDDLDGVIMTGANLDRTVVDITARASDLRDINVDPEDPRAAREVRIRIASGSDLSTAYLADGVPCPQVENSFVVGLRVESADCDFGPGTVGCASPEEWCDSDADYERWWDSEFPGYWRGYYLHMTEDAADAHWDWWTDDYEPDGYDP